MFGYSASFSGLSVNNSFNSRMQPIMLQASSPSQSLLNLGYDFHYGNNDAGLLYGIANYRNMGRSQTFTYDHLNRVSTVDSTAWNDVFTYDPWGNLLQKNFSKPQGESLDVSAGVNNQLGGYGYDLAGNMSSISGVTYQYDAENRVKGANGVTYTYDGEGERVKKSSGTIYWGRGPLSESDLGGNILREFIYSTASVLLGETPFQRKCTITSATI